MPMSSCILQVSAKAKTAAVMGVKAATQQPGVAGRAGSGAGVAAGFGAAQESATDAKMVQPVLPEITAIGAKKVGDPAALIV